jgi:phytoene synthase
MTQTTSHDREAELAAHYDYCERFLREHDRDIWLACLLAPREARKHLHALYAFANEISAVRDKVSQPLLGEMRLRWWSDTIESSVETDVGRGALAHPVVDALLDTVNRASFPREELLDLVEAHVFDLYDDAMGTVADLKRYCDRTTARLMRLAGRIVSNGRPIEAGPFDHAGVAWGITRILCDLPKQAAHGQSFVPGSLLAEFGASEGDLRGGVVSPPIRAALQKMRELARVEYFAARDGAKRGDAGLAALLPAALVPIYLDAMEQSDYEPFKSVVSPLQWRKQWRMWRAWRSNGL